jgi:hypothetical protein
MITIPEEFSKQISAFAPLFRKKVFEHAKVLLTGSLLCVGRRTVCNALRAVGLHEEARYHKYHRLLSQSRWSEHKAAGIMLRLLISRFTTAGEPVVFGLDATLERRRGQKIKARGIYYEQKAQKADRLGSSNDHATETVAA